MEQHEKYDKKKKFDSDSVFDEKYFKSQIKS